MGHNQPQQNSNFFLSFRFFLFFFLPFNERVLRNLNCAYIYNNIYFSKSGLLPYTISQFNTKKKEKKKKEEEEKKKQVGFHCIHQAETQTQKAAI